MDASTRLSYERTILSHERTLLSWLRTGATLITFGFSIYKFFQIDLRRVGGEAAGAVIDPRWFAIIMTAAGVFSLVIATIQNSHYRIAVRRQGMRVPVSLGSLVSGLMAILGLLALAAAIFKW